MPKLRLKRTPAEEVEHQIRKARKAARTAAKRQRSPDDRETHKRRREHDDGARDVDSEEDRFKEKLFGAYEDDDRLFSLEDRLNDYAHAPQRWRAAAGKGKGHAPPDDDREVNPQYLSDDEYAEWVRAGMWRRKHAAEYEEQLRQQAELDALRARENAIKVETAKLAQNAEEERRGKRREKENRLWRDAWEEYDVRWRHLIGNTGDEPEVRDADLKFEDIPWPILSAYHSQFAATGSSARKRSATSSIQVAFAVEDLTEAAISAFLLPVVSSPPRTGPNVQEPESCDTAMKKERKERLREAMLRFHPDKFEGRVLRRVRECDREKVKEAVGQVVRVLNVLMVKDNATQ